jgi:hypothetical protein
LVGEIKDIPAGSKCRGGVSLETVSTNAARITHLQGKLGTTDRSKIALFRHKPGANQTQVSKDEEDAWGNFPIIQSSGDFQAEFNAVDPVIKGIIVSASPFFLFNKDPQLKPASHNMNLLVKAANSWLQDQSRFIVYPLQIYKDANPAPSAIPTAEGVKRITFFGPDLNEACYELGIVARLAQTGASPGFLPRADSALKTEV